ncbi:MAG: AsmA family protein [Alphaproteobacteria bacterium]
MRAGKIAAIAAIVALGLLALLGVGVLVLSQLDFSRYKPLIAEQARAATGRALAIDGEIRLAPSLVPSLSVEKVRFENAAFGTRPDMVTAERLEAAVALLPLLRGEIDIRRIALIAPDILLETDKAGRGNWEFAARAPSASAPAAGGGALPKLGALIIRDGLLTYRDGVSGKATTLAVSRLAAAGDPLAIDMAGAYDGRPVTLEAKLALRGETAEFSDLQATYGGSDLAGRVSFDWSARPRVTADLASKRIDLADFIAPASPPPTRQSDGRIFSADPIDLSALRALDAKLDLKIASLRHGRLEASDAAAAVALEQGRATVTALTARFAGADLSGQGHLAALPGPGLETAFALKADKLDLAALMKALDAGDLIVGRGDLALDLKGQGVSARALMGSLGGKASWVMGKGQVKNGYVDLLGSDIFRFAASATTGGSDATAVNCLVARFDVAKGVATSQGFLFDTDRMTVKGEGTANLGAERLALKFTPNPKERSLINLALPWHVQGTFTAPSVAVDQGAAAERGAMAVLSAINPLLLLLPLVTTGDGEQNPCVAALNAPATPPARPSGSGSGGVRGFLDSLIPGR